MKKTALSLCLITAFFVSEICATRANARVGRNVWRMVRDSTPTPIENLDGSGGFIIINTPGNYQLYENITQQIKIEASNVSLDLNGWNVAGAGIPSIIITADGGDVDGVHVFNGTVAGTGFTGIYVTSFVSSTLSNVLVERISISGTPVGITIDSSANGTISNCSFIDIDAIDNNVGYQASTQAANDSYDLVFQNCRALFCKVRGFTLNKVDRNLLQNCQVNKMSVDKNVDPGDSLRASAFGLFQSSGNVLQDCQVIEMDADETVYAFKSDSGKSNLFQSCIAKEITTSAETFCNKSYGFLLTGTEEKTKIIDCIVNEVDMTSTVSAISYGIHLAPTIEDVITTGTAWEAGDDLLDSVSSYTFDDADLSALVWSPDSRYIAAVGEDETGGFVSILGFDGQFLSLIDAPWLTLSDSEYSVESVRVVDWSPDGNFIVSGDNLGAVKTFRFDGSSLLLTDSKLFDDVLSLAWSPDGHYIAMGNADGVRVFSFNENQILNHISTLDTGFDIDPAGDRHVSWSPDQRYIAVSDSNAAFNSGYISVLNFDGRNLEKVDSINANFALYSVDWSPNGAFIATSVNIADLPNLSSIMIFSFDGQDINQEFVESRSATGLSWSPDGKYITFALGGDIQVDIFDGTSATAYKWATTTLANYYMDISWSPEGKYIATASSEVSGGTNGEVLIFKAMYGPEHCLVKNCSVCDVKAFNQFVGTGITAGGTNCFFDNVCCNNEVDFSFGIPNVFYGKHNYHQPFNNIATQRSNFLAVEEIQI